MASDLQTFIAVKYWLLILGAFPLPAFACTDALQLLSEQLLRDFPIREEHATVSSEEMKQWMLEVEQQFHQIAPLPLARGTFVDQRWLSAWEELGLTRNGQWNDEFNLKTLEKQFSETTGMELIYEASSTSYSSHAHFMQALSQNQLIIEDIHDLLFHASYMMDVSSRNRIQAVAKVHQILSSQLVYKDLISEDIDRTQLSKLLMQRYFEGAMPSAYRGSAGPIAALGLVNPTQRNSFEDLHTELQDLANQQKQAHERNEAYGYSSILELTQKLEYFEKASENDWVLYRILELSLKEALYQSQALPRFFSFQQHQRELKALYEEVRTQRIEAERSF